MANLALKKWIKIFSLWGMECGAPSCRYKTLSTKSFVKLRSWIAVVFQASSQFWQSSKCMTSAGLIVIMGNCPHFDEREIVSNSSGVAILPEIEELCLRQTTPIWLQYNDLMWTVNLRPRPYFKSKHLFALHLWL